MASDRVFGRTLFRPLLLIRENEINRTRISSKKQKKSVVIDLVTAWGLQGVTRGRGVTQRDIFECEPGLKCCLRSVRVPPVRVWVKMGGTEQADKVSGGTFSYRRLNSELDGESGRRRRGGGVNL